MSTPFEADWRAALDLHQWLQMGHRPAPVSHLPLGSDEPVYASVPVRAFALSGVKLAFATSDPSTHAAAQHWQPMAAGTLHLSEGRYCLVAADGRQTSYGWSGLSNLWPEHDGVHLRYEAGYFRLQVDCPVWLSVLTQAVVYERIVVPEPPAWLRL